MKHLIFTLLIFASSIATLAAPGDLDPTFSGDGKLTDWSGWAYELAIQPDGKIVVAGSNPPFSWGGPTPNKDFLVARYNSDGSPDVTFGGGTGRVIIDSGNPDFVSGIAIQGDGKILLTGRFVSMTNVATVLIRLHPNGSYDTAFGSNGIATTSCDPSSIAVQPNGRIVLSHFYVGACRHNPDGSPDTSFGVSGFVSTQIGENPFEYSFSVVIQPDGKIVVAGGVDQEDSNPPRYSVLIRYNQDGSLDTSFGGTGIVTTRPTDDFGLAHKVLLQPDGKIVALSEAHVARYNANGSLDDVFGSGGIASLPPFPYGFGDAALQTDGKIVVSGTSGYGTPGDFAIARYRTNGSLDTSFDGGDGISTVDFSNSNDSAFTVALDSKGRAVVAGTTDEKFAIARFRLKSNPPFDYDGDGKTDFSVYRRASWDNWYIAESGSGQMRTITYGPIADGIRPVPADYDGDGKTDIAHVACCGGDDPGNITLYWGIFNSSTRALGVAGDKAVPADYDGDGKADIAVWRPDGTWQIALSQYGGEWVQQWGLPDDKPVPADFDGDGRAELAVWRPSEGNWYVLNLVTGSITVIGWGLPGDIPVVGDYSGDGKADYAVYRPSNNTWYRMHSSDYSIHTQTWGLPNDRLTPGDYDGDGKLDLAVWRPSEAKWYVLASTNIIITSVFGLNGDTPTPTAFVY